MTYTALPTVKGQITLPAKLREKYNITQETPLVIEDKAGKLTIKVMRLVDHDSVDHDSVEEYKTDKEFGIRFKKGIDPKKLIAAIKKIDG